MTYAEKQLATSSNWKDLLSEVKSKPNFLVGYRKANITVKNSTGEAKTGDKFSFEIKLAWGDCPAGCIYQHRYVVDVAPVIQSNGSYNFNTAVVESEGD